MEDFSTYLDLPVSEMQLKMAAHVPNDSESQYFSVSNDQLHVVQPMPISPPGFGTLMVPNNLVGDNESAGGIIDSNPIWTSNQLVPHASMLNGGNASLAVKRKAEVGPLSYNSISQPSLFPSKRPAYSKIEANPPGFLQLPAHERKNAPVQSELRSPGLQAQRNASVQSELRSSGLQAQFSQSKKIVRNDSMPGNTGPQRGQTAKKQTTRVVSATKPRPEPSEAVRSKMKESLATALDMVFQKPKNTSDIVKNLTDASVTPPLPANSQASELNSISGSVPAAASDVFSSVESALGGKTNDSQVFPAEIPPNVNSSESGKIFQEFPYSSYLPDEDIAFSDNFLVKDDLLQGNGLSWAFELDVRMEEKQAQDAEKPQTVIQGGDRNKVKTDESKLTPDYLATQIEAELFKLFGGVNKKYKEKGRSLLFNLKDRSNPELRERVMSGEIPPDRLCSMSAEELASKELSEWRMAKAEEFAQMVVLPDTDADMRRLVKKTHKGEYQVEVERDDGIVTEVSGGTSMLTHHPTKKETGTHSPPKTSTEDKENVSGSEIGSGKQDFSDSLIIPTDGTDLMQGIMVDELKDPDLLPPIVSLDEFMESLNAEPPFENLSADAGVRTSLSNDENLKALTNSLTSDRTSESPRDASSRKPSIKKHEVDEPKKSTGSPVTREVLPSTSPKVEYNWQGKLQLTISSSVTVGSIFQSGEKTSTKEWSTSLEIKGKVRIDAFEKFLQELPMSRTRAVMVLQFVLKDESSQDERSYLSEAVDSYTTDERLGYAEPAPGVELYLYPPTSRIADMMNKHMPKNRFEANKSMENGLIGIVVWRRVHISNTISPNSSAHHKHGSKRTQQSFPPPKRAQNVSANTPIRTPPPVFNNNIARAKPDSVLEDEDDIPPGFGPAAAARAVKDDDDLPEFNFSSNLNTHVPMFPQQKTTPVDKVRELIQKYGKSDTTSSVQSKSLVDDDDDDIPEWRPQVPLTINHQPYLVAHGRPPLMHAIPTNQHMGPIVTRTPPSGGTWPRPPDALHGVRWRQP